MSTIVIIEDNPLVSRVYENKLRSEGNDVKVAADGEEGLKLIHSVKPDLVLIDLMLPNLSGVEVIKSVRRDIRFTNLPIMAYSSGSEELLSEAVQAGTTTVISKNEASFKEILESLQELIDSTRTWQKYNPGTFNDFGDVSTEIEPVEVSLKPEVLIVEDDFIIAKIIADIAEKEGYKPMIIEDGQEAYKVLSEKANFSVAVLDVELPKIKGTDLLHYMKSEKRLKSIPVIVMTAAEENIRIQLDTQANEAALFVPKPFKREMFETLFKVLKKKK